MDHKLDDHHLQEMSELSSSPGPHHTLHIIFMIKDFATLLEFSGPRYFPSHLGIMSINLENHSTYQQKRCELTKKISINPETKVGHLSFLRSFVFLSSVILKYLS